MAYAVLTRDRAVAEPYIAALAPLGLTCVTMPLTRYAQAADPGALARALADGDYAAIVVASPRGAVELAAAARSGAAAAEERPSIAQPRAEVWAVGPATRQALAAAGIAAHVPAEARDGAELARALIAARPIAGRRVLVPRAEDGRPDVRDLLRAAGADVVDVVAYRTVPAAADDPDVVPAADLLRAGNAAITAIFAPSQAATLAAIVGPLAALSTRFCAIGETTAAALRAAGVAVAVAPSPTPEGIAHAVRSVYPPR